MTEGVLVTPLETNTTVWLLRIVTDTYVGPAKTGL